MLYPPWDKHTAFSHMKREEKEMRVLGPGYSIMGCWDGRKPVFPVTAVCSAFSVA